ncbi:unnamed protein product [Adineta steineri]|uniref:Uncharacterized protein n=1 Tax=Adineta steineri TaxID=433720 RepID=A0A814FN48_9BILA|nr:unnamed protein product [Adineta steineri]
MDKSAEKRLDKIYRLSDDITESRARLLSITYSKDKSGLTTEKRRKNRIEDLTTDIDKLKLKRQDEIMRHYSNVKLTRNSSPSPPPTPLRVSSTPSTPLPPSSVPQRSRTSTLSPSHQSSPPSPYQSPPPSLHRSPSPPPRPESAPVSSSSSSDIRCEHSNDQPPEEPNIWSTEPVSADEKAHYHKCKQYYDIIQQPLVSVSEKIFYDDFELLAASLVCVLDQDASDFDPETFLNNIANILNISDITIRKIQSGCVKVIFDIYKNVAGVNKKIEVKALYNSITDKILQSLGLLKVLFMFMGDIETYDKTIKFRSQVTLHPEWNRIYGVNNSYWPGVAPDQLDRGPHPYYCPLGWQRFSFYVADKFYQKFKGWSVCYHGTKFAYGLSILLSGLKPADVVAHGDGIYASPSIIYTAHPRYSEIKKIESMGESTFFKDGKYVQFILQCRVHPDNIKTIGQETVGTHDTIIDPNFDNDVIEWLIDAQGKPMMDFNDPNSTIVCTGLMVRVTDNHPGLLSDSQWWYHTFLTKHPEYCMLGVDLDELQEKKDNEETCNIIYT